MAFRAATRSGTRRLTRKDRVRRPIRIAVGGAIAALSAGCVGSLVAPWFAAVAAIAGATAFLGAQLGRDLAILRMDATEQRAQARLAPLRDDLVYPLNPATLPPENALTLIQQILYRRPHRILEFGSGVSTLLMARALEQLGREDRSIVSLDHDVEWREDSQRVLDRAGFSDLAQIYHSPLIEVPDYPMPWYDLSVLPESAGPFDLVLVDGPEGGRRNQLARYGGFPSIRDRLAPGALIVLDDGARDGETEIARRWQKMEPRLRTTFHKSHNGLWVFELT